MYPLLESIRLQDGQFIGLDRHINRMKRSLQTLFGSPLGFDLSDLIVNTDIPAKGLFKCRVTYNSKEAIIQYLPYRLRQIGSLKIVQADTINYSHKYADRETLNQLYSLRENCDDVLIIKQGLVTDTSNANVIFYDSGKWYTPNRPLLYGTMRQELINNGTILEKEIRKEDIGKFERYKSINAMVSFSLQPQSVKNIVE